MDTTPTKLSRPICSNCEYDLTGVTESSKCPECGKPLVDVLMRVGDAAAGVRRFRSKTRMFGLPLIDVALGPAPGERFGRAKGIIAIGDRATGLLAMGGIARGLVACGGVSIGGFSIGGLGLGLFAGWGGMATGLLTTGGMSFGGFASGGGAVGYAASGGFAMGYYATGGGAYGMYPRGTPEAAAFFSGDASMFFGPPNFSLWTTLQPMIVTIGVTLAAAACVLLLAAFGHWRGAGRTEMDAHLGR